MKKFFLLFACFALAASAALALTPDTSRLHGTEPGVAESSGVYRLGGALDIEMLPDGIDTAAIYAIAYIPTDGFYAPASTVSFTASGFDANCTVTPYAATTLSGDASDWTAMSALSITNSGLHSGTLALTNGNYFAVTISTNSVRKGKVRFSLLGMDTRP